MSSSQRRSGRISRRVPILLLGTDTIGRVFSEETTTLVLSRHGAGILSCHKLTPDETLTVRRLGSHEEAEVRLVGQMGQQDGSHVYGVAFLDPQLDFWKVEFPSEPGPVSKPSAASEFTFACEICGSQRGIEQCDIEEDVYAVNDSILCFCERCGGSTSWRRAEPATAAPVAAPSASPQPVLEPVPVAVGAAKADSGAELTKAAVECPGVDKTGRTINRRRYVRAKVSFTACVRYASRDEIVECDNVSKGGLCFRSRRHYPPLESLEIAVPYSVGEPAIFVTAKILRAEELPCGLFRYGAEYTKRPSNSPTYA